MKKLIFILYLVIGLLSSLSAQQINRLQITSPASIAGAYDIVAGGFGMNEIEPLTGEFLLIEDDTDPTSDGCTPALNDLTGFIAFVDRGACPFVDKAANAQAAGAIAMLVCNNIEDESPFVMGGDAPEITIPIAMASLEDCAVIRAEFDNGVSAILDFYEAPCVVECGAVNYPDNTVWGQNGEGTFACGLGDWTVDGPNLETAWKWDKDTWPVGQSGAPRAVDSATQCNGAAQMDFCDYNFNSIGGASTEQYFQSDLISPTIDLTGIEYPVLNFTHYLLTLRENQTIAYLSYSIDNGITWSDTIDINTQNFLGTMGGYNFETEIYLKPFIGYNSMNVSQFKFKFIANGNFYFWTIDDVYITNQPMAEFEASTQWFAGAPNFKTPSSQVDRVHFMVDAHNIGNTDFDDVSYTATITKDGEELFSTTQELGSLPKFSEIANIISPNQWDMSSELGIYKLAYTVDGIGVHQDTNTANNTVESHFMVTESTFSKLRTEEETGQQFMSGLGQNASYVSYANGYYIQNGTDYAPISLSTGFGTDIYSDYGLTTLTGEVREWVLDSNGDGLVNLETETNLVARGQVFLNPNNPIDLRNVVIDLSDNTGQFNSSGQYLAIIHVAPKSAPTEDTFMAPLSSGYVNDTNGNKDYYFAPADYAFSALGESLGRPSSLSDFNGQSGSQEDYEKRNLDPADGDTHSWFIDMEIGAIETNILEANKTLNFSLYPNPVTDQITIDLNLEEISKTVNIQIVDINGKIVTNNNFTNMSDSRLNINTSDLASGIYLVNVFTESGVKSERIMVEK